MPMTVKLKRIDVVVLFVQDVERSKAFYGDILGLEVDQQDEVSAFLKLETGLVALLGPAASHDLLSPEAVSLDPSAAAKGQLVAFVDDVDGAYAELTAHGVEFIREPIDREWGLRTAHFKDPDGHIWEIAQPIAAEGQLVERAQAVAGS